MHLVNLSANLNSVVFENAIVYFSYETPVALYDTEENILYVTDLKLSKTTAKHISQIKTNVPEDSDFEVVPADYFLAVLRNVELSF